MPRKGAHRRSGRSHARRAEEKTDARPAGRGVWSGSITFGLVTIPVELYSATRPSRVALRMLGPDGTPLARQYVCSRDEKPIEGDEIERGYELDDGRFVIVSDDELERIAPRRSRDIELTRFVPKGAIDPAYFERRYFVVPGSEQSKAYRLLANTMEAKDRVGLASFVMHGKAHAVAIFAEGGVLSAEILRFGDELRSTAPLGLPKARKPDAALVKRFERAIAKLKKNEMDERELANPESERVLDLARAKLAKGKDVVKVPEAPPPEEVSESADEPAGAEVIDLFALIQKRLRGTDTKKPARKRAKRR